MKTKDKAYQLYEKYFCITPEYLTNEECVLFAKQCALIAVENECNSLREMLFNLRSCGIIESEKVYLHRLQELIDIEKEVKQEIDKL